MSVSNITWARSLVTGAVTLPIKAAGQVDHGHADADAVVAALVDLDDLVEVVRALPDHGGDDTAEIARRLEVESGAQSEQLVDEAASDDVVRAHRVDLRLEAVVLRLQVVVLGDAPPGVTNRAGDDLGGVLERTHRPVETVAGGVEQGVAAKVDGDQQQGRQNENQDGPAPPRRIDRHQSVQDA